MKQINLPDLGSGNDDGGAITLVDYFVKPGDRIAADDDIAEVVTDKAAFTVPASDAGIVRRLLRKPGDVLKPRAALIEVETLPQ